MDERVHRVRKKLEDVRARKLSCFGSESHGFRLNPPLGEADLAAFEAERGIRLPEDYRDFLLHAGNGGAGPYHGILPLERWDAVARWVEYDEDEAMPADYLSRACPLRSGTTLEEMRQRATRIHTPESAESDEDNYQGAIALEDQGCTFYALLVVSGPLRGRVVYVDLQRNRPPYVVEDPDFLSWYEGWLDALLAGEDTTWFGLADR